MIFQAKAFVKNVLVFAASRQPSSVLNCSRQFSRGELVSGDTTHIENEINQSKVEVSL